MGCGSSSAVEGSTGKQRGPASLARAQERQVTPTHPVRHETAGAEASSSTEQPNPMMGVILPVSQTCTPCDSPLDTPSELEVLSPPLNLVVGSAVTGFDQGSSKTCQNPLKPPEPPTSVRRQSHMTRSTSLPSSHTSHLLIAPLKEQLLSEMPTTQGTSAVHDPDTTMVGAATGLHLDPFESLHVAELSFLTPRQELSPTTSNSSGNMYPSPGTSATEPREPRWWEEYVRVDEAKRFSMDSKVLQSHFSPPSQRVVRLVQVWQESVH